MIERIDAMMKLILLIGAGSFLGGIARYLLSLAIQPRAMTFPTATLAVNIIGCFCIGLVFGFFDRGQLSHEWRIFFATGVLGGFTTFSAFSNDTFMLLRDGHIGYALLYVGGSVVLGLLATYGAYQIVQEERYAPEAFGKEYIDYSRKTRRYL